MPRAGDCVEVVYEMDDFDQGVCAALVGEEACPREEVPLVVGGVFGVCNGQSRSANGTYLP
jgi:hypothetical protein